MLYFRMEGVPFTEKSVIVSVYMSWPGLASSYDRTLMVCRLGVGADVDVGVRRFS
jgi:hypothetical protein